MRERGVSEILTDREREVSDALLEREREEVSEI